MNNQMSGKMKRMIRLYRWAIPVALVYCMAFSFLFAGAAFKLLGGGVPQTDPEKFNVYGGADIYSSLEGRMMTFEFASDFKETNHYYFVYDEESLPYIIQVHGNLSKEALKIQSYLYEDSKEEPEPVSFYGIAAPIEENIRKYAIESYNEMWEEDLVTEDNFSDYFGEYYLDTTRKPESPVSKNVSLLFLWSAMLALAATAYLAAKLTDPRLKKSRATLKAWTEEKLLFVDRQLAQPGTSAYEKEKLYLTQDYIVTNAEGFEILPYQSIERIFHTVAGPNMRLMAESSGQKYHTLILTKGTGSKKKEAFQELADRIKRKIEDRKEEQLRDTLTSEILTDFKTEDWRAEAAASLEEKGTRLIPGIVGALIGALIGAALWVLIGQIGFIAGIAGFVMLKLSLGGFEKLGRRLDKRGAIICLFITAGMIFGANLLDYGVSMTRAYFEFEASFETMAYVFSNFGKLMSEMDMWKGFFVDLAIGYGLSVWSSLGAIRAIMSMQVSE
ncbi:MAG: hypothetical protein QM657_08960 [Lacrimispora sp.]|uniref:hypothetical protein n=1 Tax=Lacrimispora sp. TaxID=2719234 RepID=UPI0039E5DA1A